MRARGDPQLAPTMRTPTGLAAMMTRMVRTKLTSGFAYRVHPHQRNSDDRFVSELFRFIMVTARRDFACAGKARTEYSRSRARSARSWASITCPHTRTQNATPHPQVAFRPTRNPETTRPAFTPPRREMRRVDATGHNGGPGAPNLSRGTTQDETRYADSL